ncbi:MAG TPA: adenylate/guanylate cyclase domain-containing protein [Stellaceae bacterium]|nr:adenylate/guanylate cyclase domain-containing protein [Stellaceae bacterium]
MQSKDAQNGSERRRLLAVLAADIVAYTRLMEEDEDDTFYRLKDLNSSIIGPSATRNHGSIVKWTGNGFIGIFDSAVDAVRAAIEIQSGIAAAGAGTVQDRQMRLRIGISAGDVITVPGNVFGDTVNVAVRLQTFAAPGSICISRAIRDAVRGKFTIEYEDRGDLDLKNVADPIGAFRVVFDPIAWTMNEGGAAKAKRFPLPYALAGALVLALVATGAVWFVPSTSPTEAATPPVDETKAVASAPAETKAPAPAAVASASAAPSPPAPSPVPVPAPSPVPAPGPASAAPVSLASLPPEPAAPPLAEGLTASLGMALPGLGDAESKKVVSAYEAASGHKAQAASVQPPGLWRSAKRATADDAASSALEDCQIFYGAPCVLIATDDTVSPVPPGGKWALHDMPRVHYSGDFDPAQIPGIEPDIRGRPDIVGYRSAPGSKAAAFHPTGGRFYTVNGAASQRAAEEAALRNCNNDPERKGKDGPCFLYAAGNEILLSRRLTEPAAAPGK